jgi:hypothetical protein
VTESEWLTATDPAPLLAFLQGKASARKLRFFVTACCRQLWSSSTDAATLAALSMVEHLAEAGANQMGRTTIRLSASEAVLECGASDPLGLFWFADDKRLWKRADRSVIDSTLAVIVEQMACLGGRFGPLEWIREALARAGLPLHQQADLLRDVVRGPFRPVRFRAAWKTWNEGVVSRIAQTIYHDRAFDLLPILADALEEAGCGEAEILNHCRYPGCHVRGCWVLDLVLGK